MFKQMRATADCTVQETASLAVKALTAVGDALALGSLE